MRTIFDKLRISFAGTTFQVKKAAFGKASECEPVDITCLNDTQAIFAAGTCVEDMDLKAEVFGFEQSGITIGARGSLAVTFDARDCINNSASSDVTVQLGDFTLTAIGAAKIEAGGNRVVTNELTFTPSNF